MKSVDEQNANFPSTFQTHLKDSSSEQGLV